MGFWLQAMKSDMLEIRKSSTLIQNSLSIIEIIMCTRAQVKPNSCDVPTTNEARDNVVVAGATMETTPRNEFDSSQKHKMIESDLDGGNTTSVVDVSDSEDDTNFRNQTQTFANMKIESPSVVGKPQLPSSWTQPRDGATKKNKTIDMVVSKSDFKRNISLSVS